jgi:hypothetical protein
VGSLTPGPKIEPIAREIIEVNSPDPTNQDVTRYPFRRVRRPIWPLDLDADFPDLRIRPPEEGGEDEVAPT